MDKRRRYNCRGDIVARRVRRTTTELSSSHEGFFAEPGEWVVETDGHRIVLPDGWFRALFIPAPGEQPVGWGAGA